jgi:hypothetical protein
MSNTTDLLVNSEPKRGNTHGIFISYRREGGGIFAGILYDGLCRYYSADKIFKDVNSLTAGSDFVKTISAAMQSSDILVVVIDKYWMRSKIDPNENKLFQKKDYVHFEIREAMNNNLKLVPVLIDGASMPRESELPEDIAVFSKSHAFRIKHESISSDLQDFINLLRDLTQKYDDQTIIGSTIKLFTNPVEALSDAYDKTASVYKKDYEYLKDFLSEKTSKSSLLSKFFKK